MGVKKKYITKIVTSTIPLNMSNIYLRQSSASCQEYAVESATKRRIVQTNDYKRIATFHPIKPNQLHQREMHYVQQSRPTIIVYGKC